MAMKEIFKDSKQAFAYKSDGELRKAYWLFKMMNFNWLTSMGTHVVLAAMKLRLPIQGILKNTLYGQFVGGETLAETTPVAEKLAKYGVDVILDYGAEAKEGEANFNHAQAEFERVIAYASQHKSVPFISLKITALARFDLLEKLNDHITIDRGGIVVDTAVLSSQEKQEWENVCKRTFAICESAMKHYVGVLIDAEESWIQNTIDAITMLAMKAYNQNQVVVFNTIQLYRHDRLSFLKHSHDVAQRQNFLLGVKLVRGAYMEKERARAEQLNVLSPIQPNKPATDEDFNKAVEFCLIHTENISTVVATHNEASNLRAIDLLETEPDKVGQTFFSQLYGMSDNITFNLARYGFRVSKYLPYGTVGDVIPYLLRRAQENSSVAGQTGRELYLLGAEMKRRGL